jgi:hypothetical protein
MPNADTYLAHIAVCSGVPLKTEVAGVAMGLILEEDGRFVILTDILGSEDALGDMDFKVAGSADGVTAFQMDIKVLRSTEIHTKPEREMRSATCIFPLVNRLWLACHLHARLKQPPVTLRHHRQAAIPVTLTLVNATTQEAHMMLR